MERKGRVSRRGKSKCEGPQAQKRLESSGNWLIHNEQENKMRLVRQHKLDHIRSCRHC